MSNKIPEEYGKLTVPQTGRHAQASSSGESETVENNGNASLTLQRKIDFQTALISRLRNDNSDLQKQLDDAQDTLNVCTMITRDKVRENRDLKQQLEEVQDHNLRVNLELKEVEAHLAIVLDAREFEKNSHETAMDLLQRELEQKHNQLIKQEKLNKKTSSKPSCKTVSTCTESVLVDASTCIETTWEDQYAQTDGDLAFHPLRTAAQKLQDEMNKAAQVFKTHIQGRERWSDMDFLE
jgi:chromosome segregation ATPase